MSAPYPGYLESCAAVVGTVDFEIFIEELGAEVLIVNHDFDIRFRNNCGCVECSRNTWVDGGSNTTSAHLGFGVFCSTTSCHQRRNQSERNDNIEFETGWRH
ncbi:hypothetical protein L1987_59578 [Smallanthus sonchifolius]|uniref:Uncharacterized protein n=1 Tax=Smallanthus sonchifolius TaxID=185202 RepID=A0ACB9D5V3_9ASTR|nr:hypothetical protein L1987_59578 [Smallanthus sonchifolius]